MITSIEIENFQSHKLTTLNLSPGVNVIKGRSHGGKSSIVRALKWALLNQPRGDHFVSHFKDKKERTAVGVEFDDGSFVIRKKEGTVNGYDLPNNDIAAIRSDLPDEVKDITHMAEINVQTQDQHFYMLNLSPGKVAKELNSLVGLDIIDETITKLNRLENENTARKKLLEEDKKKINKELKELDFVGDLEERVESLETLIKEKQELHEQLSAIRTALEEAQECEETIKENTKWLKIREPVAKIQALLKDRASLLGDLTRLENVYQLSCNSEIVRQNSDQRLGKLILKKEMLIKSDEYKKLFCRHCGAHVSHWRKK